MEQISTEAGKTVATSVETPCISQDPHSVAQLVQAIARSSAYTVATGKQAFYSQIDRSEDEAYEQCELVMTQNALAHDAQEGMTAFLEKRHPIWRDE